jgi:hypothetical protein
MTAVVATPSGVDHRVQQPATYGSTPASAATSTVAQGSQPTPPLIAPPTAESGRLFQAPAAVPPRVTAPVAATIQQPSAYVPMGTKNAPSPTVVQPNLVAPPKSKFASYYDEPVAAGIEEEEEGYRPGDYGHDDEEDDEEEEEDDDYFDDEDECDDANTVCGFELGGWIEQGFTFNGYDPRDGRNGTVVLNDFANQWQMNQLWLYANRDVDNGGCGWDWGGRFDVLFGTDAELFQMQDGLEESWDQNGQYQVALLRFYYDIAYNDWTLRAGKWDSLVGYEPYDATESFFYSRSYNFYAQPGSLLGLLLTRHLSEQFWVSAGLHRGDNQFDDTDGKNAVDFIGGFSWRSVDEETWLDAYLQAEEQGIGNDTLHYSLVGGTMLTESWEYVGEWYWGQTDEFAVQAQWYGFNQHLMKEINDRWSYGFRFEWFRDDDGFIITGFPRGNSAQGPFDGNFYEATFAVNYTPCENFALRPECRWDWYDSSVVGGPQPFDDGTRSNQFIVSLDAVWAF